MKYMEKLDIQTFRKLKQEVIDLVISFQQEDERDEYLSGETQQKTINRYKEIINILSEHDLRFYNDRVIIFLLNYDLDDLIKSGLDFTLLNNEVEYVTNLQQIKELSKFVSFEDFQLILTYEKINLIETYGIETLIEYGIEYLNEVSKITNDIYEIRDLLKKRPIDLINMGVRGSEKKSFIKKYGIDNIVALDEETGGYAVINDFELNEKYRHHESSSGRYSVEETSSEEQDREMIFKAFQRGLRAFIEEYDRQNPKNPLTQIILVWVIID